MRTTNAIVSCLLGSACAVVAVPPVLGAEGESGRPNIVLILIDDMAWNGCSVPMDDGMANSRMPVLQMPRMAQLARDGMRFRNAYVGAPQCAPSRVCIQTGMSAPRSGFTVYMNSRSDYYDTNRAYSRYPVVPCISDMTIDAAALTIPEALRPLGYASAHFGKWHMRGDPGDEGYVAHDGNTDNKPGNQRIEGDPKLMFSITERSLAFMRKQAEAETPFYLQVSHYAMHAGRECLPGTRSKYQELPALQAYYRDANTTAGEIKARQDPATWLGMGEDLDGRIGAILDELKRLDLEKSTYVIVTSDNGYRHRFYPGLSQPHHGGKWWVWQGGLRVPMVVRGPGIRASAVFGENVVNYDFLPTFVEWAGGDPGSLEGIDGVSLAGYLRGKAPDRAFRERCLYFHYPHYRTSMPHSAIVSGTGKVMHFYERPDLPMLFDLAADMGEAVNLASARPEEHRRLFGEMMRYFEQVGARIPKVNESPDADVYRQAKEHQRRLAWGAFEGTRPLEDDEK